ncbi:MAG: lipolytic enzyme family [Verrucomicrobia bacterium]|nr:lipolytic enzyme family [Verrucomicrobiota bacterium]
MTPIVPPMPIPNRMDSLLRQLKSGAELGVPYVDDTLGVNSPRPAPLLINTQLRDPSQCGRRARGWVVAGGVPDGYTFAVLRDLPMLGNRSQFAQFSFRSTQTGVARGEHGLIEMRLCRGTTSDDLPLRIRIENGAFYVVTLNGDMLIAGDRVERRFTMSAHTVYTLSVLLFQKAVFARLRGPDVPDGAIELVVPDRRRFIPGRPGFGLRPNPHAAGGELEIFDWTVTPVGPAENCRLAAIGDSITAGVDMEPEAESYVHLATQALGQQLVLNTGSGGADTALNLGRFPFEISPFKPGLAWIESGGADIANGLTAESAFQNMMGQAKLVTWGGKAVLSTISPLVLITPGRYEERMRLNRMIRESGLPFVDRDAVVRDPADPHHLRPQFSHTDRIHITKDGHAHIADEAIRIFRKLSSS